MPAPPTPPPDRLPGLHIISPAHTISNATTESITVSGTAQDADGIAAVSWANSANPGEPTAATGTTAWSATVPLRIGTNTITVKATTTAGAVAWRDLTVVRSAEAE